LIKAQRSSDRHGRDKPGHDDQWLSFLEGPSVEIKKAAPLFRSAAFIVEPMSPYAIVRSTT
jgi:hypothetical protein